MSGNREGAVGIVAHGGERVPLIDMHCHILPGFDDGASDLEQALNMARFASCAGVAALIATPHVMQGVFEGPPGRIVEAALELQSACDELAVAISIRPGSEVYLDHRTADLLKNGKLVTLGGGKHVLLELPQCEMPYYTCQLIFEITLAGYIPVLAHPERNATLRNSPRLAQQLAATGVVLQLNSGSLFGKYGRRVRQSAERWLSEGLYSAVGSDWHSPAEPNSLIQLAGARSPRIQELLAGNAAILGVTAG